MANRIGVVTDSTSDLPPEIVKELDIKIVPLNVHFGEETFVDGVEITVDQFYRRLQESPILPTTSQPSPGMFKETYEKMSQEYDTIISIHISQKMSGTVQSARMAAEMVKDRVQVVVIDSQQVCVALGMMVMEIARLARKGAALRELVERIASYPERSRTYFTVPTLDNLQRTGRIGKAAAFLGQLLNIKPILSFADGLIIPVEKVRGTIERVILRIIEIIEGNVGNHRCSIAIAHGNVPDILDFIEQSIHNSSIPVEKIYISKIGSIVGSHAGPGAIGLNYLWEE